MKKKILSALLILSMLSAPAVMPADVSSPVVVSASAAEYTKLAKPTSLKAKVSGEKITLSWKKVKGAEAYGIYKYDSAKKKYVKVKNVTSNKITITAKGAGTYKFRVYSLDKVNGKYKKGNYAYKSVKIEKQENALDRSLKGLSLGMSKSKFLDKIEDKDYFVTNDIYFIETENDDELFCYQIKDGKLTSYGVAYEYSDSKLKALKKLFDSDEWVCLNENGSEFTKNDLKLNMLIYLNDNGTGATVMYEASSDLLIAIVIKT